MKKTITFFSLLFFSALSFSQGTINDTFTVGDYEYKITSNTPYKAQVITYTGAGGSITIPTSETHMGVSYNITSIKALTFRIKNLTAVIFPSFLEKIGGDAFKQNDLVTVTFPATLTRIDNYAFTRNKFTTITIPSTITTLGYGVFCSNTSLTEIIISAGFTGALNRTFCDTNSITKVTSHLVTPMSLSSNAFSTTGDTVDTRGSIDLIIPAGTIDAYIAASWTGFKSIQFTDGDYTYEATSTTAPYKVKIIGYSGMGGNITIPSSILDNGNTYNVTSIGDYSFPGKSLTSVTIPLNVINIGEGAFASNSLTSVVIPLNVGTLGGGVFNGNSLTKVISESVSPATLQPGVFSNINTIDLVIPAGTTAAYTTASWTGFQTTSFSYQWTGTTNTDWATGSNWVNGTTGPSNITDYITIPNGLTNYPTITSATTVNSIEIASGASFIASGVFTGEVTYNRNLPSSDWHLISSPVIGQDVDDFVAASGLATNGTNIGLGTYATASDSWSYYQSGTSNADTFSAGTAHSINLAGAAADVSFVGSLKTDDTSVVLDVTGAGFNLIGNPYTAFVKSANVLTTNTVLLDSQTLWIWDPSANGGLGTYQTKITVDDFKVAPGQAFFVESNGTAGNLTIDASTDRSHQTSDTFLRSSLSEIHINLTNGLYSSAAKVYYIDGTTTGFDNGFDGKMFGGASNESEIYTHLLADNIGDKYVIQSLPNSNIEQMIIPVGIKASQGDNITINTSLLNMATNINVYLEDKQEGTFTLLNNNVYSVTLTENVDSVGRFYVHTTTQTLSVSSENLTNIGFYKTADNNLRITGLQNGNVSLTMFDVLGKRTFSTSFKASSVNNISLPVLKTGIYIVQLITEQGKTSKKIILE
ncbi:MAG: leucine-rich repeat protein [Polaribacter sp.]|uniref:leucine-rich repeat protein n=1 Tax=Polaribacter sp. TaxID=1920175 RepID=UPI002F3602D1